MKTRLIITTPHDMKHDCTFLITCADKNVVKANEAEMYLTSIHINAMLVFRNSKNNCYKTSFFMIYKLNVCFHLFY